MQAVSTTLIFLSGDHPGARTLAQLLPRCQRCLAADGGYDLAVSLGVKPDALIGDMDSLAGVPDPSIPVIRHPVDKDWSDTELALDLAWRQGAQSTILFGGGGGRLDHLLAIRSLFQRSRTPDRWYTGTDEVIRIDRPFSAVLPQGTVLSLFPLGIQTCRARTTGLKWPLDDLAWQAGDCGLSNLSVAEMITIQPLEGSFLLVRQLAEGEAVCRFDS